MADFKSNFVPAFPYALQWNINPTPSDFSDAETFPKRIGIAIPVESIAGLVDHLMKLERMESEHKIKKIYDHATKQKVEKYVVYLNGKGMDGEDGYSCFGSISPRKIERNTQPDF